MDNSQDGGKDQMTGEMIEPKIHLNESLVQTLIMMLFRMHLNFSCIILTVVVVVDVVAFAAAAAAAAAVVVVTIIIVVVIVVVIFVLPVVVVVVFVVVKLLCTPVMSALVLLLTRGKFSWGDNKKTTCFYKTRKFNQSQIDFKN